MRGAATATTLLVCALLAGCGGNSGNTTIINNNQTTVTTAEGSTTTVPATTTTAPVTTTGAVKAPPPAKPVPEKEPPGPEQCGDRGVVNGGAAATADEAARPGYVDLEAQGLSCSVAMSIATAWVNDFEVTSCGAGCVHEVGDLNCRYAGSGSTVGCYGRDQQLTFAIAYPE